MSSIRVLPIIFVLLAAFAWCQGSEGDWRAQVRQYAEARQWNTAMAVVDTRLDANPADVESRAWRARLLLWAGRLDESEMEWNKVVAAAPQDPDNWLGIAGVYSRRGQSRLALDCIDKALRLDPRRSDIHVARARLLVTLQRPEAALAEFRKASELDPGDSEVKKVIRSLHSPPKHCLRLGTETDVLSYSSPYQFNDISLQSKWSRDWETSLGGGFYERNGLFASKLAASVSGSSKLLGSLTLGGAVAHDNGIIPRSESLFIYDRGWKLSDQSVLRGVELAYGQHWYWYSTARVMALTQNTVLYFARDWTFSLALTGARTQFDLTHSEWSPSGASKLSFPLLASESHGVQGNVFFASGTENFTQLDQIRSTSSRTFGGGLRFQVNAMQDITTSVAYQLRSQQQRQISLGATYAFHF